MRIKFFRTAVRLPLAMATVAAAFTPLFSTRTASASPRPLPFTYPYETLPEDSLEIEQYVDDTPVRASEVQPDGSEHRVWDSNYTLQTEVEYGITDHLELGTYVVFEQLASAADPTMSFDGIKERLRYRFAEAGEWPVDVALYLEGAELHDEYEIEEKVILGKHIGKLSIQANAWVEQEFERGHDGAFIYNPTIGVTYPVLPQLWLGVEYWARGRFAKEATSTEVDDFNQSTHHWVGPAVSLQFGRFWWSVGPYLRLDRMSRSGQVGDEVGRVWVRSVFGLEL